MGIEGLFLQDMLTVLIGAFGWAVVIGAVAGAAIAVRRLFGR